MIMGMGHVGKALRNVITTQFPSIHVSGIDIDPNRCYCVRNSPVDVMHYTIPFVHRDTWVTTFLEHILKYQPKYVIIESTIVPSVVDYLQNKLFDEFEIYYSPIRATESIMQYQVAKKKKYYAPILVSSEDHIVGDYLEKLFPNGTVYFADPKALIIGKLFETSQFGVNIALVNMFHEYCVTAGINFAEAYTIYALDTQWQRSYNSSWMFHAQQFIDRPIFRPGKIGGNCVMQNIELMNQYVDSFDGIWRWVKKINERQEK